MNDPLPKDLAAPIIEAVLDIDCAMPPTLDLGALEAGAKSAFSDRYPKSRRHFIREHLIEAKGEMPAQMSVRQGIQAFQFLHEDEKQLVQVRVQGFSFNRLAPYSSLDDYLPEIERTWRVFLDLVSPVLVNRVRLRYINRILLPAPGDRLNLDDYLKIGPRLPDEDTLTFVSFLNQHTALETETGNLVQTVLTNQPKVDDKQPIILDIETARACVAEPGDWSSILATIRSLRELKNRVFRNTLTEQCLQLLRH